MLQWAFRIGLAALVASVLLGAAVATIAPAAITDQQARVLETIGNCLVAVWFVAGVPLWVASVTHLWRNRQVLSRAQVAFWSFFLLTLSLLTTFIYFPRFVRDKAARN
jgi:hypothetical protein